MVMRRMAMRMIAIFVALMVCGMFFPDLARGNDYLSTDKGLEVDFGEVVVGEQKTIPLGITNKSDDTLSLILLLNTQAGCSFEHNGPVTTKLMPGDTLDVDVTFTASDEIECMAWLQIMYSGSDSGAVEIEFTGIGIPEASKTPEEITVGGIRTGVYDRIDKDGEFITDMIAECEGCAYNHGQFVSCVIRLTRQLRWEGTISGQEKFAIQGAAVKAAIRNVMHELKSVKRRSIWRRR